jgi:hypothetical protein
MFAFFTGILIAALLQYAVTYSLPVPQPTQAVAGTVTSTQPTPD